MFFSSEFLMLDLPALTAATLAAVSCALIGNFLVLRRLSLMGDAISHAVLPGIVMAFIFTDARTSIPMLIGAATAGMLTAVLVELLCKFGRVESGAAMGVVFSILFAFGVLLLEQAAARHVDLDADCVLYGQLEDIIWLDADSTSALLNLSTWSALPREVLMLAFVTMLTTVTIGILYKELKITAFDPALATTLGFNANIMHYGTMLLVSIAVVASFEAVGSILVIAMLICPPAAARLLTDRLRTQIMLSVALAALSSIGGYILATMGPIWLGADDSLNAAGMIAVVSGIVLVFAIVGSPSHGILASTVRRRKLSVRIAREDLLALLYRARELSATEADARLSSERALEMLGQSGASRKTRRAARRLAIRSGLVLDHAGDLALTEEGMQLARSLVRTHRLWEAFLVRELGLRPDHVHRTAMNLEHVTSPGMERRLVPPEGPPMRDPHDKPIPDSESSS